MGIGFVILKDVDNTDSYMGGIVRDGPTGCTIELWDNLTDTSMEYSIGINDCIDLRNFLDKYIDYYKDSNDE